jgi:hypothetical protein
MKTQQDIVAAVVGAREAMDGFMAAFNAEDRKAMQTRWLHFPHVRFHSGKVTVMETPDDFTASVWERTGEAEGWAMNWVGLCRTHRCWTE